MPDTTAERHKAERERMMQTVVEVAMAEDPRVAINSLALRMSELLSSQHALEVALASRSPEEVVERHETRQLVQGWARWRTLVATAIVTGLLSASLAWMLSRVSCSLTHDQAAPTLSGAQK